MCPKMEYFTSPFPVISWALPICQSLWSALPWQNISVNGAGRVVGSTPGKDARHTISTQHSAVFQCLLYCHMPLNAAIVFKSLVLLILFSFLVAFWGDDLPSSSLSCDQSLWVGKFWDTAPLQNYFSPSKIQGDLFKFSTNSWEHKESTCT